MQKKNQIRVAPTAGFIPAMLEGSFATAIENRFAQMNNQLAREGRLTNDPMALLLTSLRDDLKAEGLTFERVVPAVQVVTQTTHQTVTTTQGAPQTTPSIAPKAMAAPKAPKETSAVAPQERARECKPEQLMTLQVPGSVNDNAIYGTDSKGRRLAPYGVKLDGSPMKRRGRVAEEHETQAVMPEPQPKATQAVVVQAVARPVPVQGTIQAVPFLIDFNGPKKATAAAAPTETATEDDDDLDTILGDLKEINV